MPVVCCLVLKDTWKRLLATSNRLALVRLINVMAVAVCVKLCHVLTR